jgi:CPA2 family monovalent cation:H+ antiporter-2
MNVVAGIIAARLFGFNQRAAANIGLTVLGRGEFSLILATLALGAGLDSRVGPFVALYVLVLALLSPLAAAQSRYLARIIPDRLLRSRFRYVREETISTSCAHLDQIVLTEDQLPERATAACAACLDTGDDWVQLRICLSCGEVACCDDSVNRHATAHAMSTGHPIVQSMQPGEDWRWCYLDAVLVREPMGSRRD